MSRGRQRQASLGDELAKVRFGRLYREQGRAILSYALARVDDPDDATDVVAETFLELVPGLGQSAPLWRHRPPR